MSASFNERASQERIDKTIAALEQNGFHGECVQTEQEALARIKALIPTKASVNNGSSKTLEQIGFIEYLKSGTHGWNNAHDAILAEKDPAKQALLRKQSVLTDYYLGSVHAATEAGELIIASNTGSQLPHLVFTSPNIILVVGAQKITATLHDAMQRLEEYVLPLEDAQIMEKFHVHTILAKVLILKKENPMLKRNVRIIFVNEVLGF